jgi:hypothetical protein
VTLFTVNCKRLLDEAAIAEKKQEFIVLFKSESIFRKTSECLAISRKMAYDQAQ